MSELSTPATFSVKIADELKNTDSSKERTYSVVRIHGEKAEVIDSTFDEAHQHLHSKQTDFPYMLLFMKIKQNH